MSDPTGWTNVLASAAYSLAGFLVGFGLGRVSRDVHDIKESVVTEPTRLVRRDPHQHGFWRWTDNRVLGLGLLALSILTLVFAFIGSQKLTNQAQCQSEFNVRFGLAYQARAASADGDRNALNNLMLSIAGEPPTPQGRAKARAAFEHYIAQIKTSDATRRAHPLPDPPNPATLCK